MQLKPWLALLILGSSLAGCKDKPPVRPMVDVCMVSAPDQGCICSIPDGSESYFLTWEECDKYVAMPPNDFHALALYIVELEQLAKAKLKVSGQFAGAMLIDMRRRWVGLVRGRSL